ncbi:MAG: extracellular solute-binding protein [Chloroflexota bacterium]|nr:extracellular solute-binding protein [Anaerolineae bacterium]HMM26765.1 extracellular solute-binding protein [Aggregatilineaceae bacterium]
MSKSRLVLTVLLAFSLMIAAFGVAAPAAAQEGPVTLTITCRCVAGGVNNNLVVWLTTYVFPTFEKMMADQGREVKVELVEFGGSDEQLKEQYALDLSVGSGYDIMSFDGFWVPEFVGAGLLKPLEEVAGPEVNDWEGWGHISPGIQAILGYQGKVYGLPMGTDVRQIFYRTDLFQQAGIEVPWQPASWEEILEAARALKDAGVSIPIQLNAGTPMGEATTMQGWFMALLGGGHHLYDFEQNKWIVSSPGILDALNLYKTIYVDEELGDARMQLLQDGRNRSFVEFRDGNVGMLVEGDWFWRSVIAPGSETGIENRNEIVSWAKMPAKEPGAGFNGQDFVTISGGTGWVINPNTEHPAEAWALLSYMSGEDPARAFELMQPRISFRDDVPVAGDPVMTAMAEALLPLTTVRPMLPEYPQVSIEAQLMTERVVSGEMSPEEAMQAFDDAVTELVGEENVIRLPLN